MKRTSTSNLIMTVASILFLVALIRPSAGFQAIIFPGGRTQPSLKRQLLLRSTAENMETSSSTTGNASDKFPRAAVSTAVRCHVQDGSSSSIKNEPHYLLIQRGNPPNAGKWSFPGGKLEWGESTIAGAQRELTEETSFDGQDRLQWHSEPYATADSIIAASDDDENGTLFHFLIAIAFAQLQAVALPSVISKDDAKEAKWWAMSEIQSMTTDMTTPGLVRRVERAEFLYQKGVLL